VIKIALGDSLSGVGGWIGSIASGFSKFVQNQTLFSMLMIGLVVGYVVLLIYLNNQHEKTKNINKPKKTSLFKLKI